MAGSRTLRVRGGRFTAALAVSFLASAAGIHAQYPSSPAATPGRGLAEIIETEAPPDVMPPSMTAPAPTYYPSYGAAPTAPRVEMGLFDTITASIFEDPNNPNPWRPLSLGTFF